MEDAGGATLGRLLIIGVRHGIGEHRDMVVAGSAGTFQRGGVIDGQPARGQGGGMTFQPGMDLEDGEEFLQCRLEHLGPAAGFAPQDANRVKLKQSLAHRRARDAKRADQSLFFQNIARRQRAVFDAFDDVLNDDVSLIAHAA